MPQPVPFWAPPFTTAVPFTVSARTERPVPAVARRWLIVEAGLRLEVDESTYLAALPTCERIEVARYPHESVVTHLCYRNLNAELETPNKPPAKDH